MCYGLGIFGGGYGCCGFPMYSSAPVMYMSAPCCMPPIWSCGGYYPYGGGYGMSAFGGAFAGAMIGSTIGTTIGGLLGGLIHKKKA